MLNGSLAFDSMRNSSWAIGMQFVFLKAGQSMHFYMLFWTICGPRFLEQLPSLAKFLRDTTAKHCYLFSNEQWAEIFVFQEHRFNNSVLFHINSLFFIFWLWVVCWVLLGSINLQGICFSLLAVHQKSREVCEQQCQTPPNSSLKDGAASLPAAPSHCKQQDQSSKVLRKAIHSYL